jgi:hypothetical protein
MIEETRQDAAQAFAFAAGVAVCRLWRAPGGLELTVDESRGLGKLLFDFFVNIGYRGKKREGA